MTPKEKAKELYDKFLDCPVQDDMKAVDAILCAELAVDEIIKVLKSLECNLSYWQEVKTELDEML